MNSVARTGAAARPTRLARVRVAMVVGIAVGTVTLWIARRTVLVTADFGVAWSGARALLAGVDPYASVGPGRRFPFPWPNLYPLPASIVDLPIAALPGDWARALFAGVTGALAAFGLTRRHWHPLLAFVSAASVGALMLTQWSYALLAAATVPGAAWLAVAKPNVGLACAAYWHTRRQWAWGVVGTVVLTVVSVAAWPPWPAEWIAVARQTPQVRTALLSPGGALVFVLALLRWRRPEARLLAALAVVPHTPAYYDALLLFVVPETLVQSLALTLLTWAAFLLDGIFVPRGGASMGLALAAAGPARQALIVALLYLPCVVMVLRRTNTGTVPPAAERAAAVLRAAVANLRRSALARRVG